MRSKPKRRSRSFRALPASENSPPFTGVTQTEKSRRGENVDKEADAEQVAWKGQLGDSCSGAAAVHEMIVNL